MEFLAGLHPKIVHFPIALLLTYTLLEFIGAIFRNESFSKAAYIILVLGILGAITAVLTGNQADEVAEILFDKDVIIPLGAISQHETYATITLWFFAAVLVFRTYFLIKKKFVGIMKYVFVVLALIGSYFVLQTGLKGGSLVYQHGVGTDLLKPQQTIQPK
ncbi:MAG: hypothetical protein NTX22_14080 [Ignavibacteriales bacterium]|nr:hypothetical protein [Ignavibacteriales bacterium]